MNLKKSATNRGGKIRPWDLKQGKAQKVETEASLMGKEEKNSKREGKGNSKRGKR